ncbi:uroporphyrinogen-III synthase [Nevskia soli]|jgi:uroporphyrinogen-III synthase|uniref:uroporphyrinogen-III synthase n=1 Tax=Nevskia soli TaxID=418856 RepID=UPI001C5CB5B3|nr:uroporphyrinogen-III synthase [Nevskia soli]
MGFDGAAVLALESRRAAEMEKLITMQGGRAFVAPALREAPIEANAAAFAFAEALFDGAFDMVILLTGVGTRYLQTVIETRFPPGRFAEAMRGVTVVARGPKPVAVCRELGIPIAFVAPEPNTWHEVLDVTSGRPETRIAVQEYGKSNPELIQALEDRGATVTSVPVYQWTLPEDTAPLRQAVRRLAAKEFAAAIFTTSSQVDHLVQIAEQEHLVSKLREGLDETVIGSIGPTTSETLADHGFTPDFVPSHPKMGMLVVELAREFARLRGQKQRSRF